MLNPQLLVNCHGDALLGSQFETILLVQTSQAGTQEKKQKALPRHRNISQSMLIGAPPAFGAPAPTPTLSLLRLPTAVALANSKGQKVF